MSSKRIIVYHFDDGRPPRIELKDGKHWRPLRDRDLKEIDPHILRLNKEAREKVLDAFLKEVRVTQIRIPNFLPPAKHSWHMEDPAATARHVLSVADLFGVPSSGYRLLAVILASLHATALRRAAPGFSPYIAISLAGDELIEVFRRLTSALFPRSTWKKKRLHIRREAVLDFRQRGLLCPAFQDFSRGKVTKCKHAAVPIPYADTTALIIHAPSKVLSGAADDLRNAGLILANCSIPREVCVCHIPVKDLAEFDPTVLDALEANPSAAACLLTWWLFCFGDSLEAAWAEQLVKDARASFGKPDGRYRCVELEPKALTAAILYRVLLSFLDQLLAKGWLTAAEAETYRLGAKAVFDPDPAPKVTLRPAEDPEVFLAIMRRVRTQNADRILAEGEPFVPKKGYLAAYRMISGKLHLIFPEEGWLKLYRKEAKADPAVGSSFFDQSNWENHLLKLLADHELTKTAKSTCRYRYDLYGNNTRDTTYVVAIPAHLLED